MKPWSISTTVRNPLRLREFLRVLQRLEGQDFDEGNQVKYQILLIQERLYKPNYIPDEHRESFRNLGKPLSFDIATEIFDANSYEDPPMRGRQSVNPLNKLGFAIARNGYGPVQITDLGKKFLAGEYDVGEVFFKSLLKLQFPNPWSTDFSAAEGFNIAPLIATMHLLNRIRRESSHEGLNETEFKSFVPTLTDALNISQQTQTILQYRRNTNKEAFKASFLRSFYEVPRLGNTHEKNLHDYGDNTMRYFRLTKYFKVVTDPTGANWTISLEAARNAEIEQLLSMYDGQAAQFDSVNDYLRYLSDISQPALPWEEVGNLRQVAQGLVRTMLEMIRKSSLTLPSPSMRLISTNVTSLEKRHLGNHILKLRELNLKIREMINKSVLTADGGRGLAIANILRAAKDLRKYAPEQFEKLITTALQVLNDEIEIRPNYPVDDEGEPISWAPGNKPDIECQYHAFRAICEVTLDTSRSQWMREGQPVMRHLREYETLYHNDEVFCIFVAPMIHTDTYSQFWTSVKYEYDGQRQKIVPLTAQQFAMIVETVTELAKVGKRLTHARLRDLYTSIVAVGSLRGFSNWSSQIPFMLSRWKEQVTQQ